MVVMQGPHYYIIVGWLEECIKGMLRYLWETLIDEDALADWPIKWQYYSFDEQNDKVKSNMAHCDLMG